MLLFFRADVPDLYGKFYGWYHCTSRFHATHQYSSLVSISRFIFTVVCFAVGLEDLSASASLRLWSCCVLRPVVFSQLLMLL